MSTNPHEEATYRVWKWAGELEEQCMDVEPAHLTVSAEAIVDEVLAALGHEVKLTAMRRARTEPHSTTKESA